MHEINDDFENQQSGFNIDNIENTMMEMVYETIMVNVDDAIKSETPIDEKLKALTSIIKYFEDLEAYEKCANIKKIIEDITC